MYIDKVNDIAYKSNNTYHSTIKVKPVDVNTNTYVDFGKQNNKKDLRFKVGDLLRISKYENTFTKGLRSKLECKSFCD